MLKSKSSQDFRQAIEWKMEGELFFDFVSEPPRGDISELIVLSDREIET